MDAVQFLIHQHRQLEQYLSEALDTRSEEDKQIFFNNIADHLAAHIAVEEQVFYPAVHAKWTEYDLLLSLEEHLSLKRLVTDLSALQSNEQTFHPKLKVLMEQAVHHHRVEEEYLFPKVNTLMNAAERATLGQEMQDMQHRIYRQGDVRETVKQTDEAAPLI